MLFLFRFTPYTRALDSIHYFNEKSHFRLKEAAIFISSKLILNDLKKCFRVILKMTSDFNHFRVTANMLSISSQLTIHCYLLAMVYRSFNNGNGECYVCFIDC